MHTCPKCNDEVVEIEFHSKLCYDCIWTMEKKLEIEWDKLVSESNNAVRTTNLLRTLIWKVYE